MKPGKQTFFQLEHIGSGYKHRSVPEWIAFLRNFAYPINRLIFNHILFRIASELFDVAEQSMEAIFGNDDGNSG
jgi:hypothetical protein